MTEIIRDRFRKHEVPTEELAKEDRTLLSYLLTRSEAVPYLSFILMEESDGGYIPGKAQKFVSNLRDRGLIEVDMSIQSIFVYWMLTRQGRATAKQLQKVA